jgi:hypothetical protein
MNFCKHEYGKWSEVFDRYNQFTEKRQTRRCEKCGKIVVRKVWWSGDCSAQSINLALKLEGE